ncbi:MAG TPA: caspase family protein, partial [Fimbriimonas sp.]|nr:caspase family protein [Fimbriimonas sp.]
MIGTLAATLLLSQAQAPQIGPGKVRALFIGVDTYTNGEKRAMRGDLDAQRMAHLFRFQLGVPAENVKVLDQHKDLTKKRILEEIDNWLIGKSNKDDALVLYWSGQASSFSQPDGRQINAIIPIDYSVTPDGKSVMGNSLIFTKELRTRFSAAKKTRGLKDLLWIVDSTFSPDSIGGEDRYSCLFESQLDESTNTESASIEDKNPENFVVINAGSDSKLRSQLELPTGPNGEREPISPLAYAFHRLGNRLTTYISYLELESELRAVALETREDRQPKIVATSEIKERTLFGGHATTRRNYFAVGVPNNKQSPFVVVPGKSPELDPMLPVIPVG